MLEKIAEMVREDVLKAVDGCGEFLPCFACDRRPKLSEDCEKLFGCPDLEKPDGSLMLARWAVLLVARGLEKELGAVEAADEGRAVARFFSRSDDDRIIDALDALDEAFLKLGEALYRLTHEAKEGGE